MNKTAGIVPNSIIDYEGIAELKQALLLFDQVGLFSVEAQLKIYRQEAHRHSMFNNIANELEYIHNKGLLIEAFKPGEVFEVEAKSSIIKEILQVRDQLSAASDVPINTLEKRLDDFRVRKELEARLACIKLNHDENNIIAFPLVSQLKSLPNVKATKQDVIKLVVNYLPVPDNKTPWDNIFEFKSNPDNKGQLAGLRDWMNKAVKSGNSINEINDELEYLLSQYTRSLEIHKIKYKTGILQTLLVGGAELVENLMKFKFSAIAKGLFSAQTAKAELHTAELTAPGNALAYLYKANNNFV